MVALNKVNRQPGYIKKKINGNYSEMITFCAVWFFVANMTNAVLNSWVLETLSFLFTLYARA